MQKKKLFDLLERAGWTAVQAFLGFITADALDIPAEYAVLFAAGISVVKSWVAGHLNNTSSVSSLPTSLDPAAPPL